MVVYARGVGVVSDHIVRVSSGKYTFVVEATPAISILRYGEPWHRQQDAFNAMHSIMCELDAARVVLDAVRQSYERGELPMSLCDALHKHEALVSDNEKPSMWTAVRQ
jgi:hypothetical protein